MSYLPSQTLLEGYWAWGYYVRWALPEVGSTHEKSNSGNFVLYILYPTHCPYFPHSLTPRMYKRAVQGKGALGLISGMGEKGGKTGPRLYGQLILQLFSPVSSSSPDSQPNEHLFLHSVIWPSVWWCGGKAPDLEVKGSRIHLLL